MAVDLYGLEAVNDWLDGKSPADQEAAAGKTDPDSPYFDEAAHAAKWDPEKWGMEEAADTNRMAEAQFGLSAFAALPGEGR